MVGPGNSSDTTSRSSCEMLRRSVGVQGCRASEVRQGQATAGLALTWPALDTDLEVNDGSSIVIAVKADDWLEVSGVDLLLRTLPQPVSETEGWPDQGFREFAECVRTLRDQNGHPVGRGCLNIASSGGSDTWKRW